MQPQEKVPFSSSLFFKEEAHGRPAPPSPDFHPEADEGEGGTVLVCRACGHRITRESARIQVLGQHRHVFYNPQGVVFELGCFAMAPGCHDLGPTTKEFTWFPGYVWQPVFCGFCHGHLGWRYRAESGNGFFGLILECLVEESDGEG